MGTITTSTGGWVSAVQYAKLKSIRYFIDINILQNHLINIDIFKKVHIDIFKNDHADIDIDIFQIVLIDISISISIFSKFPYQYFYRY